MSNDAALMPYISSCNIACGGHFGSTTTMREAVRLAKLHNVKVGAHPSYPDRENFGRKSMSISSEELTSSICEQISDFLSVCNELEVFPNHIKLHGALYNDCMKDEALANVIFKAYEKIEISLPVFTPPNSLLTQKLDHVITEAFLDRRYNEDGSLVSRAQHDALIEEPHEAWNQLYNIYFNHEVISSGGKTIPINADTFCLHGDTTNSLEIAQLIDRKLKSLNISLNKNG